MNIRHLCCNRAHGDIDMPDLAFKMRDSASNIRHLHFKIRHIEINMREIQSKIRDLTPKMSYLASKIIYFSVNIGTIKTKTISTLALRLVSPPRRWARSVRARMRGTRRRKEL